jgi:hypothetical protein
MAKDTSKEMSFEEAIEAKEYDLASQRYQEVVDNYRELERQYQGYVRATQAAIEEKNITISVLVDKLKSLFTQEQ